MNHLDNDLVSDWDLLSEFSTFFTKKGLTSDLIQKLIKERDISFGKVLVIGIGTGQVVLPLKKKGTKIIGIDSSRRMVEKCRENKIECLHVNILNAHLSNEKFDNVIVATGVLDCMDDVTALKVIEQCYITLKNKGRLYIIHFDHRKGLSFLRKWKILDQNRVYNKRKIDLWLAYDWSSQTFEKTDRLVEIDRFYSALRLKAKEKAIPFKNVLNAFPEFHTVRTPDDISEFLIEPNWKVLKKEKHDASSAFYVIGEKQLN